MPKARMNVYAIVECRIKNCVGKRINFSSGYVFQLHAVEGPIRAYLVESGLFFSSTHEKRQSVTIDTLAPATFPHMFAV